MVRTTTYSTQVVLTLNPSSLLFQTFPHSSFPWANTEDANLNVGMPIFSINGNHDDPTGSDNLCALDILSASGLINFFGKVSQLDEINIAPIVLRKGKE